MISEEANIQFDQDKELGGIMAGEGGIVHRVGGASREIQNCDAGGVFIANNECLLEKAYRNNMGEIPKEGLHKLGDKLVNDSFENEPSKTVIMYQVPCVD